MFVQNNLVCPSNVSQSVDVNVFISAGPNFELAIPNTLEPLAVSREAYPKYGGYQRYPMVKATEENNPEIYFQNKNLITEAYWHGLRLFLTKRLEETSTKNWYDCIAPTAVKNHADEEVYLWLMQVSQMKEYQADTPQFTYMSSFPAYSAMGFVQAAEAFITTRESGPQPLQICAGARFTEVAPTTVSEDAMNLQTVLRRFYPVVLSEPIYSSGSLVTCSIPVTPVFSPQTRYPIRGAYGEATPTNQISWFSRLFTWWRGSLRYLLTLGDSSVEAFVYFTPHVVYDFKLYHGVLPSDVQHLLSFASMLAVTRLQGSIQFEVPFQSPYNQLLLDHHQLGRDLRSQNGTVWIAFRPKTSIAPRVGVTASLFMSTGEDFVMNLIKAPPKVSELMPYFYDCKEHGNTEFARVDRPELKRNLGDHSRTVSTPVHPGFNYLEPLVRPGVCHPKWPPGGKEVDVKQWSHKDLLQCGDIESNPGPPMLSKIFPSDLKEDLMHTSAVVRDAFSSTKEACVPAATAALNRMNELLESVQQKMENFGPQKKNISKYVLLSSQIITAGAVLHCIRKCLNEPILANFLTLGVTTAALIGLVASESVKNLITSVVNWVLSLPKTVLNQTQALDDSVADWVSLNETHILSVTAVIGVVIYAFIFDVIPSFSAIKKKVQEFFEDDEEIKADAKKANKVQAGLMVTGLRNAHFATLGLTSLEKVYTKIMALVQRFIDWLLDRDDPTVVAARAATEHKDRIIQLVQGLDELDDEATLLCALRDPLIHNRVFKLVQESHDLTEICLKEKLAPIVCSLITECRRRSSKLVARLKEVSPPQDAVRYDPFVICFSGETACGKTKLMATQITELIKEELALASYNLVYTKNINDQYWSGYTGQPIIFWDEFGQNKEMDKVIPEFMSLKGNSPVTLNMAAVSEKGRFFTSQVILMTTNVPYVDYNTVRDNDAFKRRRNLVFGFQLEHGHTPASMDAAAPDAFPNWEHCAIRRLNPMAHTTIGEALTLEDLKYIVRTELRAWHAKQLQILEVASTAAPNRIPDGLVPIVVEEDDDAVHGYRVADVPLAVALEQEVEIALPEEYHPRVWEDLNEVQAGEKKEKVPKYAIWLKPADDLTPLAQLRGEMYLSRWSEMSEISKRDLLRAQFIVKKNKLTALKDLAERTFQIVADKVMEFVSNHPRVCLVMGIVALLASVAAVVHVCSSSSETEGAYETGPTKTLSQRVKAIEGAVAYEAGPVKRLAAKSVVVEGAYDANLPRKVIQSVVQGSEDPVANDIVNKIHPYVLAIAWLSGQQVTYVMRCFHVKGTLILAPKHFFNGAQDGNRFALLHRVNDVIIEFQKSSLHCLPNRDWCIYNAGPRLEPAKHMTKYFIREQDLGRIGRIPGVMLGVTEQGTLKQEYGMIAPQRKFEYADVKWKEVYSQKGWDFTFPTQKGECGSVLVGVSSTVLPPGKILGVHVAGIKAKNWGFSTLVIREELEKVCDMAGQVVLEMDQIHALEAFDPNKTRIVPRGDYTLLGNMPPKKCVAQPLKSSLIKTPWFDSLPQPPPKIPAFLMPFYKDDVRISPLKLALEKYGRSTAPFPSRQIIKVKQFVSHLLLSKLVRHTGKRIYSEEEAVLGIPDLPFAERLNMKSSCGWPYQVMEKQKPGKWHLFSDDGKIIDSFCKYMVEERISKAKQLERISSVWRDCLKDELRPYEKAMAGKTRLFTIGPVDFTIVVRMYFMDFVVAFYTHAMEFFSAVGINPESFEWTRLYDHLASVSSDAVAGDFKHFDGMIPPELLMAICENVNDWYDDGEENKNVRRTLFNEIIHTAQLVENLVYMTHQGNPSGNPLTVIINTMVAFYYLSLSWLSIYPDKTLDDFTRSTALLVYGDDTIMTVSHKCSKFNFNSIRQYLLQYGIEFTTDLKSDSAPDFTPLQEVTFLKRGFRKDPKFGNVFILPTMSKETLEAFFYYYRKAPDVEAQLQENMRAACAFAVFHGEDFYNSYVDKWHRLLTTAGYSGIYSSFEEQVDVFRGVCEMTGDLKSAAFISKRLGLVEAGTTVTFGNSKLSRVVAAIIEAPLYYLLAPFGSKEVSDSFERSDNRWAAVIPSGEGKSWLANAFPHVFVDHDELLMPVFQQESKREMLRKGLPWNASRAREFDFPIEDRRILLVHHPNNTKRQIIGSFITHYPSFIRANVVNRLRLSSPIKMSREERNQFLLQFAQQHESHLFKL